jgi:Zn-dependent M28 family amino/carboxypeptidase
LAAGVFAASWIVFLGCQGSDPSTDDDSVAASGVAAEIITADSLRHHVARLSADEMEGRSPGTAGTRLARQYLAETMAGFGLEPAFAGQWEQTFDLVSITSEAPQTWSFTGANGNLDLEFGQEFIATSGVQAEISEIDEAELVFVGYGIQAPEYEWDDFKGRDLTGKVLVMLNNDPNWDDEIFEGDKRLYYGRWDYKYESAAAQGAAAAIIIHTTPSAGYPWQVVQTGWTGAQFELPGGDEPRIQIASWVTEEAAQRLAALAGQELDDLVEAAKSIDFEPAPLGLTTSLSLVSTLETVDGANVGGLLQGSDSELASEVVVFTAHHDHLGKGEPNEEGDDIYNGALDNASGSASVLAIAEAFSHLPKPPARSLLFLFVDGEEQGLLGSEYFARHPTFEPGRIAANINIDGANIWGRTRDIALVGYGKSSLDAVVEELAGRQGRTVKPEQFPDKGYFYRSDQFNFAKIGVPAIYADSGVDFVDRPAGWGKEQMDAWVEVHYHQPTDELDDSWNFDGYIEDTVLLFEAGQIIAESPELPAWNPGDEFEAGRLEALAALQ